MNARKEIKIAILIIMVASVPLLGQSGGGYDLTWSTIDGGGAMSSAGGALSLSGTIGQPDAQIVSVMSGGTYELTGGFWPVTGVCYCLGDLNGDGKRNAADVQRFVNCILIAGNCSCADVNAADGVTTADISIFVADLLAGDSCP